MATQVEIWNMALGLIGAEPVATISDNTRNAKACATFYETTKLNLLRSHNWNFALKRSTLNSSSTPAFEFLYAVAKPTDYLRIVSFYNYRGEFKEEGGNILLNQSSVQLKYVRDDVSEADFDPSFVVCLASKLAHVICYQITQSATLVQSVEKIHKDDLSAARRNNAISNTPDNFQEQVWLAERL